MTEKSKKYLSDILMAIDLIEKIKRGIGITKIKSLL
jgi:phenylalanyl-tRNA synthetase beta subunit